MEAKLFLISRSRDVGRGAIVQEIKNDNRFSRRSSAEDYYRGYQRLC